MPLDALENQFEPTANGVFMARAGPSKERLVNKKLCFTATDKQALVAILLELSRHEACYFVKYSIEPKDGMYLGRCFLNDESLLGQMWKRYKPHPRVMCNVQDDDFVSRFR